ncbi:MAG: DUF3179 domain-containing protein [Acidobacteria bacterium]|nr:MAG: DUF3179 domain-containing protein [Acidobacteriota bacterium]
MFVPLFVKRRTAILIATAIALAACGGASVAGPSDSESPASDITADDDSQVTIPIHLESMAAIWETDFSNSIIDLEELLVGIPLSDPRDAIPPIDNPQFEAVSESDWIQGQEPGVLIEIEEDARFYPLSVMTRHEIVNDEVGGIPVAVTYCPLCNTALVFDRRFEGETLRLGVSGLLRNSDLVMWDDVTQTLWQQVTGEAIVGRHAGKSLTPLASAIVRWADFRDTHPDGQALSSDQGFGLVYGSNPYEFYSSRSRPYSFYSGEIDDRFPALERVVGISVNGIDKAYPFSLINKVRVVHDNLAGQELVVFWGASDTADALDSGLIADAIGIGTGIVYNPFVDGERLTFVASGDTEFVDNETGTTWSILGKATSGELAGEELELLPHRNEFWFAWQAFFPDAEVWTG